MTKIRLYLVSFMASLALSIHSGFASQILFEDKSSSCKSAFKLSDVAASTLKKALIDDNESERINPSKKTSDDGKLKRTNETTASPKDKGRGKVDASKQADDAEYDTVHPKSKHQVQKSHKKEKRSKKSSKRKHMDLIDHERIVNTAADLFLEERFDWEKLYAPEGVGEDKLFQLVGIGLFEGTDIFSVGIKGITNSKFSHAGVILADITDIKSTDGIKDPLNLLDANRWYCLEATGSASEVLGGRYPYTRVTKWDDVIRNYGGGVSHRVFNYAADDFQAVDDAFKAQDYRAALKAPETSENYRSEVPIPNPVAVTDFVRKFDQRLYETNFKELLKSVFNANRVSGNDRVFCSELLACILYDMTMIPKNDDVINGTRFVDVNQGQANNWVPAEFYEGHSPKFTLLPGIDISDTIQDKPYSPKWWVRFAAPPFKLIGKFVG